MKILLFLFGASVAVTHCSPVNKEESVARLLTGTFLDCLNSDLSLCLKENALKAADRLRTVRNVKITEGLTLINNGAAKEGKSLEPLSTELEVRRKQLNARLWESATDLFQNSDLEYSYDDEEDDQSRALDDAEGRGKKKKEKKKKLKLLISLAILAKVKAAIIAIVSLVVIAASLAKIAFIAKIAFLAKLAGLLKSLLQKKLGHEEHTVVTHEEHAPSGWDSGAGAGWSSGGGGGGGSGWSRRNAAMDLAYSAQAQ